MYNIDIHNRIKQLCNVFHRMGMMRIEDEFTGCRQIGWRLLYLIFEVLFILSVALGCLRSKNRNESIFLLSGSIVGVVIIVKLIYILWKRKEIREFVQVIGTHSVGYFQEFVKVNQKVNNLMKFSSSLLSIICVSTGVVITFSLPVFSTEKRLPFNLWYPFDWQNNEVIYWITFAFVLIGTAITVLAISLNVVLWYLMTNCAIKYYILGNQFRNMFLPKPANKMRQISKNEEENLFLQEFIGLIKTHRNIKETIYQFKFCFENLFFAQITTSGICICGSVYTLAFGTPDETLIQRVFYVVFMLYNIFDIFMVMYLGNEIKLSSDRLSYCLYKSNWMNRPISYKKYMIILAEVLKKPHELEIGKVYPLNMGTFISIVNFAYSMFNILKTLK